MEPVIVGNADPEAGAEPEPPPAVPSAGSSVADGAPMGSTNSGGATGSHDPSNVIVRSAFGLAGFDSANGSGAQVADGNTVSVAPAQTELTPQQVNAVAVRQHEEEVLQSLFRWWIMVFCCVFSVMVPAVCGILVWMLVEAFAEEAPDCDVPLRTWCMVVLCILGYTVLTHGSIQRDLAMFFCRWQPEAGVPSEPPFRVKVFYCTVPAFALVWDIVGLILAGISGSVESEQPACIEVAPRLRMSVMVYAVCNLVFTIVLVINFVGLARVLAAMLHHGLLHSPQAAPKGALEANTASVSEEELANAEADGVTECCVCLEKWDGNTDIVKTKACSHIFHKKCLQGWLNVNRNCPLCRGDLGCVGNESGAAGDTCPA